MLCQVANYRYSKKEKKNNKSKTKRQDKSGVVKAAPSRGWVGLGDREEQKRSEVTF